MLVLEGADALGKTHFAQRCVDYINKRPEWPAVIYSHFTRLPGGWDYLHSYRPYVVPYSVQDRFHMSEVVYGSAYRGHSKVNSDRLRVLDAWLDLAASYTVVFYCGDDGDYREMFTKSEQERPEMYKVDTMMKVNELFTDIVRGRPVVSGSEKLLPRFDVAVDVRAGHYADDQVVADVCGSWLARVTMHTMLVKGKEFRHELI